MELAAKRLRLSDEVPRKYKALYLNLEQELVTFEQELDKHTNIPTNNKVSFSASVLAANSNAGERLLFPWTKKMKIGAGFGVWHEQYYHFLKNHAGRRKKEHSLYTLLTLPERRHRVQTHILLTPDFV